MKGSMNAKKRRRSNHQPRGQIILYEDRDVIVVDKAPGLLTMATDKERVQTAYFRLTDYVRKGNPKSPARVFIVHRLDREVSGILLFARTAAAKKSLQDQWDGVEKHYLAMVHGKPADSAGTFTSYLVEEGVQRVHATLDAERGRLSQTAYRLLGSSDGISLLDIQLLTGRKHQIRVHLADHGLPILGDTRYGRPRTSERRLALHARSIAFDHPHSGERCYFETRFPHYFTRVPVTEES